MLDINRDSHRLLALLILADLAFILLHLVNTYGSATPNPILSIEDDAGYAEVYQHVKEFWIVIALVFLAIQRVSFLHLSWSLLFLYFLADDSLRIHENSGYLIAQGLAFQPVFGLSAQDFGEIAVSSVSGAVLFGSIALTHFRSGSAGRRASKRLFGMVAVLVFFGVVVDLVHSIVGQTMVTPILAAIEDGGEMLVISVITWFVFSS